MICYTEENHPAIRIQEIRDMKEANFHSPSPLPTSQPKFRGFVAKAPLFLIFLALGYVLGFLTASSNRSAKSAAIFVQESGIASNFITKIPESKIEDPVTKSAAMEDVSPPPLLTPRDLLQFRTNCADPVPHFELRQTILDHVYGGVSPYDGFPSPATAELLLPPKAQPRGWGSRNQVFADLVESVRPLTIIELGTFLGASALHMAGLTRNLSLPTLIICLDDFRGWPGFRRRFSRDVPRPHHGDALLLHQFMLGVARAGEAERVLPLPFSTSSALTALCEWGVYGDLIEVDAGHDFHSAWADINMAYAVLRPGGVLFGHDYYTKADNMGVHRAVDLFARINGLKVRSHGQHWVLSPKPPSIH